MPTALLHAAAEPPPSLTHTRTYLYHTGRESDFESYITGKQFSPSPQAIARDCIFPSSFKYVECSGTKFFQLHSPLLSNILNAPELNSFSYINKTRSFYLDSRTARLIKKISEEKTVSTSSTRPRPHCPAPACLALAAPSRVSRRFLDWCVWCLHWCTLASSNAARGLAFECMVDLVLLRRWKGREHEDSPLQSDDRTSTELSPGFPR